jgi:hypothetical protein
MKTTVYISDSLHEEARKIAALEKTTVRALIEQGLQRVIADRRQVRPFRLRRASFMGDGLHPDVKGSAWGEIREKIYAGRGAVEPKPGCEDGPVAAKPIGEDG